MKLKVLSWNLNHRNKTAALWDYIGKKGIAIFLFQEFQNYEDSDRTGLTYVFDKKSGIATYSAFPITKLDLGIAARVLAAKVSVNGKELTVVNIHNYPGDKGYYTSSLNRIIDSLDGIMKNTPNLVIGGDLNVGLYYDRKYGGNRNADVLNRIESYGLARCPLNEEQTHRHKRYKNIPYPDDFVFVGKGANVVGYEILNDSEVNALSDHNPVVVEIDV